MNKSSFILIVPDLIKKKCLISNFLIKNKSLKFEIRQGVNNRDVFEDTFGFSSMRKHGKENIMSNLKHAFAK